ncbi:MAG TPA: diacylglycerol kinase family protein [Clostridia bacterium]|nr:diacylglycerol kinase family protein [Clostridia bacterium]
MKHVFVINPKAGKGKALNMIKPKIDSYCAENSIDSIVYVPKSSEDSIEFMRTIAQAGEPVRIYACGGDGTIYNAVNAVFGFKNAEIAAIPLGSGNDFIRLFGKKKDLMDIGAQVNGTAIELDVIKCGDRIAINQCSMGLDAEICAKQSAFKKLPLMNGETAYTAALFYCLMKKIDNEFTIQIDDDPPQKLKVLFSLCANSRWYGGGYKGAPLAIPDDGLLDFVVVKKTVGRMGLFSLVGKYKAGQHLDWDMTTFKRGKKMIIHSEKLAAVNIDGESDYVHKSTFEIIEKGIKFVVSANSTYIQDR